MADEILVFSGLTNRALAEATAGHLGIRLASSHVEHFPDGELTVRLEEQVRRKEVFIIQPTSPPVNENLIELLVFADACRRASAGRVTAIVPYFGYARADKRHAYREPITARMVADLFHAVHVDHVVTLDLHSPQIEGFFHTSVDTLTAVPTLFEAMREHLPRTVVVVSPDAGRIRMASEYAQKLGTSVVVLHKCRESGTDTKVTHVVGNVEDRPCLIIDDMISTGGTIAESIDALLQAGALREMTVAATHGLFVDCSVERFEKHEAVRQIFVTDSVPLKCRGLRKLTVVSIAPLLAGAIRRLSGDGSLGDLS